MIHLISQYFHLIIPTAQAADSAGSASVTQLLGIDWKLFLAQLFNFVIVLLILWKWVFGPLGKKLQERSDKIEKSLTEAKEIEEKLKSVEQYRNEEAEKARHQANDIIVKAQKAAEQAKQGIMDEARASAERIVEQARKQIENEKNRAMSEIREEAANMIVSATEKIIREKLDPKKDAELIKESLKEV